MKRGPYIVNIKKGDREDPGKYSISPYSML